MVYPKFQSSLQSLLLSNTIASIATLDIVPCVEVGAGVYSPMSATTGNPTELGALDVLKLTQASPSIDPNRPFVVRRLKPNTKYRVMARAYNVSNSLISLDASSYSDVSVLNDDAPILASVPVTLTNTPFAATTSVTVKTSGRFDYLKTTLCLATGNTLVPIGFNTRPDPIIKLENLQANTTYRLVAEAYKFGTMMASNSVDIAIGSETAPATQSLSLSVPFVVTTLAGNCAAAGNSDGTGVAARFNTPHGIAVDASGNCWVCDLNNGRVCKVTPAGVVTTFVAIPSPLGIAIDSLGNFWISSISDHCIRKVTPAGAMTVVAGNGAAGWQDGAGTSAQFNRPHMLSFDSQGNLIIADASNYRVRKMTPAGVVSTIAGNGVNTVLDGQGTAAQFAYPSGMWVDRNDNIFVGEHHGHVIRKITPSGLVKTYAGIGGQSGYLDGPATSAKLMNPASMRGDDQGNLYVTEWGGYRIRKISAAGMVTTELGNGTSAWVDGTGAVARFAAPMCIDRDPSGVFYFTDLHGIRKLQ